MLLFYVNLLLFYLTIHNMRKDMILDFFLKKKKIYLALLHVERW